MMDIDLIHDVNAGNVLEVQIEVWRSADLLMSEIIFIYLQHLESKLKALDCHV